MKKIALIVTGVLTVTTAYFGSTLWAQAPGQVAGSTRIAFVNLAKVFQEYQKAIDLKKDIEITLEPKRLTYEKLAKEVVAWKAHMQSKDFKIEEKERYERGILTNTRNLEDLQREMQQVIAQKNQQHYVQLYKDISEATARYAAAQGFTTIFVYVEPFTGDPYNINNIMRKVQGMDMGGSISALYVAPGLDVSAGIVTALNQAYATTRPAVPATPVSQPKQ